MSAIVACCQCGAEYQGTRTDARRAGRWELYRAQTQADIDHGPLICLPCVAGLLDGVLSALRGAGPL